MLCTCNASDAVSLLQTTPTLQPPKQNKLSGDDVVPFVASLRLSYLKLQGNPCVSSVPHYRKVLVDAIPALNYLDEAPVRARDKRLASAFVRGGFEARA